MIHQLLHQPRFLRARRVAGYFGRNGEIDPCRCWRAAAMHKHRYLPVLHPFAPAACGSAAGIRANGCDSTAMAYPSPYRVLAQ